jgi:hypothetical protein
MDVMGLEINSDANKMTKKMKFILKQLTFGGTHSIQQSMLPLKTVRFLGGRQGI